MARRTLIIPSESRHREFDAKLLLGCVAAEAGFRVVVGSRHDIHAWIGQLPPSVYLAKDVRASSAVISRILRQLGHTIVAWDEEALVYHNPSQYLSARVAPEVLNAAEMLFAWGPDNAEIWRTFPEYGGAPIHAVGNPRLDFLRPALRPFHEQQRRMLKIDFGDYVLINSNFGSVNHILPGAAATITSRFSDDIAARRHLDMLSYRKRLFSHFLEAAAALARALPKTSIVVRPHPAENPEPWQEIARNYPNLHVRHDGGIVPWLLGAKAIVHNGCTTAVEAAVMGRSAIAYMPIEDARFDIQLPNALSRQAKSVDDLICQIRAEKTDNAAPEYTPILQKYLSALDGALSCDRIVDRLFELDDRPVRRNLGSFLARVRGRIKASTRRRRKSLHHENVDHKNGARYSSHRFPAISEQEVHASISALRQCLGRFESVSASELRPNIFDLTSTP
jgi:surface carbohydrate biosynthesis protein